MSAFTKRLIVILFGGLSCVWVTAYLWELFPPYSHWWYFPMFITSVASVIAVVIIGVVYDFKEPK